MVNKAKIKAGRWRSTQTPTGNLIISSIFLKPKIQKELRERIKKSLARREERDLVKRKQKLRQSEEWKEKSDEEFENHWKFNEYKYKRYIHYKEIQEKSICKLVSVYINIFKELHYCLVVSKRKNPESKYHKIEEYLGTIDFFFDYADERLPQNKKFTKDEKICLNVRMASPSERKLILSYKADNLIEKIKLYLLDLFVVQKLNHDLDILNESIREKIKIICGLDTEGKLLENTCGYKSKKKINEALLFLKNYEEEDFHHLLKALSSFEHDYLKKGKRFKDYKRYVFDYLEEEHKKDFEMLDRGIKKNKKST